MAEKLAQELIDASNNEGNAMKKKPKGPAPLYGVTKKRASFFLTPFVLTVTPTPYGAANVSAQAARLKSVPNSMRQYLQTTLKQLIR